MNIVLIANIITMNLIWASTGSAQRDIDRFNICETNSAPSVIDTIYNYYDYEGTRYTEILGVRDVVEIIDSPEDEITLYPGQFVLYRDGDQNEELLVKEEMTLLNFRSIMLRDTFFIVEPEHCFFYYKMIHSKGDKTRFYKNTFINWNGRDLPVYVENDNEAQVFEDIMALCEVYDRYQMHTIKREEQEIFVPE
ncbi:MAG: hypothetical protein ACKOW8_10360 [Flavobacteriales bacterium]